jgi:hypothetical protein
VDEKLGDLPTVGLIRWQCEDHLNRADEPAVGKSTEKQPAALLDLGCKGFECGAGLLP